MGRMTSDEKMASTERMRNFLGFCESVGTRPQDLIDLTVDGIAGGGKITFSMEALRHLVSMEE